MEINKENPNLQKNRLSTLERHVVLVIKTKGGIALFSELYLKVYHDMDINDFRCFLEKMENNGTISKNTINLDKSNPALDTFYTITSELF